MTKILALVLTALLVVGCDQKPKEVSIIQQFSELQSEWQDVAMIYGFAFHNVQLAEATRDAFAAAFPDEKYQVVTRVMPMWKYERLKKEIEAP